MTQWKEPQVPRHVIQMIVMDAQDNILFLHRSDKVRSAKNVWSTPSGLHDIGETIEECGKRELYEEYGLEALPQSFELVGQYENIAGDENPPHYHWVVSIYIVYVKNVWEAVNKEPDKHDIMLIEDLFNIQGNWWDEHQFHPTYHDKLKTIIHELKNKN